MFNWQPHYTGIETAEAFGLYLQRDHKTKTLQFWRWGFSLRRHGIPFGLMFGMFLGHTNHLRYCRGVEVFTTNMHAAYTTDSAWRIKFSGSQIDPRHSYTMRLGHIAIGSRTDRWLKRWLYKRDAARMDIEIAAMDAAYEAHFGEADVKD